MSEKMAWVFLAAALLFAVMVAVILKPHVSASSEFIDQCTAIAMIRIPQDEAIARCTDLYYDMRGE